MMRRRRLLTTNLHPESIHGQALLSRPSADLGSAEGCAAFVKAVPRTDILVNNVGIFTPQDFFETPDDVWERHFAVNVMSGVRLSRAYLPDMVERGWGRVIFLSSESGLNIPAYMIPAAQTAHLCSSLRKKSSNPPPAQCIGPGCRTGSQFALRIGDPRSPA